MRFLKVIEYGLIVKALVMLAILTVRMIGLVMF